MFSGFPDDFFAVNGLVIHHGADFALGSAQVEADAAASQVAAQLLAGLTHRRYFGWLTSDHGESFFVNLFTHEVKVKFTLAIWRIDFTNMLRDEARTAYLNLPAAALPEQEFYNAIDIVQVSRGERVAFRENDRLKAPEFPIVAFQPDDERYANPGGILAEGPVCERSGAEIRVKRWDKKRLYQVKGLNHTNLRLLIKHGLQSTGTSGHQARQGRKREEIMAGSIIV
jgi:hypothetical protein